MEVSEGLLAVMMMFIFLRAETLIHTNALNHEKANERGPGGGWQPRRGTMRPAAAETMRVMSG